MYKFTNHLTNAKLVLVRRHIDGSSAALIVLRSPRRQYAQNTEQCATPPPPRKSHKLFWGTVGATVLTGAAVVYAKSSPEARNWLESNAPWANDLVALVYGETGSPLSYAIDQFNKTTSSVSEFVFGKEGVTPPAIKSRAQQDIDADAAKGFSKKDYQLPPPSFEPLYVEEKKLETPEVDTPATLIQTDKCEPGSVPDTHISRDLVQHEHDMHAHTKLAVEFYTQAAEHCRRYNDALFKIVESSLGDLEKKHFVQLQGAQSERDAALEKAKEAAAKAKCAIETVSRMLAAGVRAPPESVAASKRYIQQFRADVTRAEELFRLEHQRAQLSDRYWNKVESARLAFKEELQALFPGVDISAKTLNIKGDTDLLLLYTLKQVQFLQNQLAELQTVRELKINRAIECHDEKALIDAKVEDLVKTERIEREKEFLKRSLEVQAEANRNLREQLKKQFEIQQEVLHDKLAAKEKEILSKLSRSASEQVEKERVEFKRELAAMAGKLKAIEHTLKQRAAAESASRRSMSLWSAAHALHAATLRAERADVKLTHEIAAIEKAGKDDKLVQTILKGIPSEVKEQGVVTEQALRESFDQVEKTCLKVALVGRDGASLPVYFLSWLQSKLLFHKFSEIPQDELENKPVDFTQLDTFDIMQRARYHMEHGDVTSALRYTRLVRGAAQAVAQKWATQAQRHLEVRQAAAALMAHASAAGLLHS